MGFDEVYKTQSNLIAKITIFTNDMEPNIKSLASIINNINSAWTSDAGEKYYIIQAIQKSRKTIGSTIANLRTFTLTSKVYLKEMHEFNKYTHTCKYGSCSVSNITASKSSKTKIKIDTEKIKKIAASINSVATNVEDSSSTIGKLITNIDSDLAIAIVGGKNVLQGYKNKLTSEAQQLRKIATAIKKIAKNYETTEKNLQKQITDIEQINNIADSLTDGLTLAFDDMLLDISKIFKESNSNSVEVDDLLKNLENLFGSLDEFNGSYDNIKKMLEYFTGDKLDIPVLSDLMDLYSQLSDKYHSTDDFIKAIQSGEILDNLKDPKKWAEILRDGGKKVFGKGYAFLADSAYYVTTLWTEELQEWYKNGGSGNVIKDSIDIWAGVGGRIVNDAVDAGKNAIMNVVEVPLNTVTNGINAIYNTADNFAETFLHVDLDAAYNKLGINVRDTINNFTVESIAKESVKQGKKIINNIGKTIAGWF